MAAEWDDTPITMTTVNDEQAVSKIETLLRSQPYAQLWSPVTPFDYDSRRIVEGRHPDVIIETFGRHVEYFDFGCGPDAILVRLLRERGAMAFGSDWLLKREWYCLEEKSITEQCDVVICREVLEHVPFRDIRGVIHDLIKRSKRYIYVTTRFAKNPSHFLSFDTSDDLDPTHITMLTKPFLRTLFVLEGCKSRPDLEAKMDWQKKGRCLVFEVGA